MQSHKSSNQLFYQKKPNTQNQIVTLNDIVKVNSKNYSISHIDGLNITGIDMYNNKLQFTLNDIEKITFQNATQHQKKPKNKEQRKDQLRRNIKSFIEQLNNSTLKLSQLKILKDMIQSLKEELKSLETAPSYKQSTFEFDKGISCQK